MVNIIDTIKEHPKIAMVGGAVIVGALAWAFLHRGSSSSAGGQISLASDTGTSTSGPVPSNGNGNGNGSGNGSGNGNGSGSSTLPITSSILPVSSVAPASDTPPPVNPYTQPVQPIGPSAVTPKTTTSYVPPVATIYPQPTTVQPSAPASSSIPQTPPFSVPVDRLVKTASGGTVSIKGTMSPSGQPQVEHVTVTTPPLHGKVSVGHATAITAPSGQPFLSQVHAYTLPAPKTTRAVPARIASKPVARHTAVTTRPVRTTLGHDRIME